MIYWFIIGTIFCAVTWRAGLAVYRNGQGWDRYDY